VSPGFGIACIAAVQRAEVEQMIRGHRGQSLCHRDATMIRVAYGHGLRRLNWLNPIDGRTS
jgi:hypothetical protein